MEAACELVWEGPSAISGSRWRVFCWTDRAISGTCACACVVRFRGEARGACFCLGTSLLFVSAQMWGLVIVILQCR